MNKLTLTLLLASAGILASSTIASAQDATYNESGGTYTFTGSGTIPENTIGANGSATGLILNENVALTSDVERFAIAIPGKVTLNDGSSLVLSGFGGLVDIDGDVGASFTVNGSASLSAETFALSGGSLTISGSLEIGADSTMQISNSWGESSRSPEIVLDLSSGAVADRAMLAILGDVGNFSAGVLSITLSGELPSESRKLISVVDDRSKGYLGNATFKIGEDSFTIANSGGLLNWVENGGISTLVLSSSIPEPSTFGLLAGLGALALVASRRRRRSRKTV